MRSLAEKLNQVVDAGLVTEGQGMPKAGWAQKVKKFASDMKSDFLVSMKRDAQGGDFNDLLNRVYPGILDQINITLKKMFPQETTRQRRLLDIVSQELGDLTQGIVTTEDSDLDLNESWTNTHKKILMVFRDIYSVAQSNVVAIKPMKTLFVKEVQAFTEEEAKQVLKKLSDMLKYIKKVEPVYLEGVWETAKDALERPASAWPEESRR